MIGSDSISLLFRAKGDTSDAKKAFSELKDSVSKDVKKIESDVEQTSTSSGVSFGKMAAVATALAAALAGAGVALFNLAKSASDYGSEIKDASDKTGLGAETLSSLKVAADQSGSSLEQVASAVSKFSKLIGEAATGSQSAKDKLKQLGIDPKKAIDDLDGSLAIVFKRIAEAPNSIVATKLATDAFGKSGADIIPVIKSFDGDMAGLIKRCKELGIAINDEAMNKADEFGDQMDTVNAQMKGVTNQIGFALMPAILRLSQTYSTFLADNKDGIVSWGQTSIDWLSKIVEWITKSIRGYRLLGAVIKDTYNLDQNFTNTNELNKKFDQEDAEARQRDAQSNNPTRPKGGGLVDEAAARQRQDALKKQISELGEFNKLKIEQQRETYEQGQKAWQDALERGAISFEDYKKNILANMEDFAKVVRFYLKQGFDIESQGKDGQELATMRQAYENSLQKFNDEIARQKVELEKKQTEAEKKAADESIKIAENKSKREIEIDKARIQALIAQSEENYRRSLEVGRTEDAQKAAKEIYDEKQRLFQKEIDYLEKIKGLKKKGSEEEKDLENQIRVLEEQRKEFTIRNLNEFQQKLQEISDKALEIYERIQNLPKAIEQPGASVLPGDPGKADAGGGGFFSGIIEGIGAYLKNVALVEDANGQMHFSFSKMFESITSLGLDAFAALTQGFGQMLSNWVLYGDTGGLTLRKLAAQVLANLAAVAAQYALMCLAAAAFASTAFGAAILGGTPGQFLAAAAMFGLLAVGAAVAGRAIAGDSFKGNQAASASTRGAYGTNQSPSRAAIGAYSGQPDGTISEGRTAPALRAEVGLTINDKSGWFAQMFEVEWNRNGRLRKFLSNELQTV